MKRETTVSVVESLSEGVSAVVCAASVLALVGPMPGELAAAAAHPGFDIGG